MITTTYSVLLELQRANRATAGALAQMLRQLDAAMDATRQIDAALAQLAGDTTTDTPPVIVRRVRLRRDVAR